MDPAETTRVPQLKRLKILDVGPPLNQTEEERMLSRKGLIPANQLSVIDLVDAEWITSDARSTSELSAEQTQFLVAISELQIAKNAVTPTWLEVLDVMKKLGYVKSGTSAAEGHSS